MSTLVYIHMSVKVSVLMSVLVFVQIRVSGFLCGGAGGDTRDLEDRGGRGVVWRADTTLELGDTEVSLWTVSVEEEWSGGVGE